MGVCKHIFITSNVEIKKKKTKDFIEAESFDTCFCVKCGQSLTYSTCEYTDKNIDSIIENFGYEFYEENESLSPDEQVCFCDKDLGIGIYKGIIRQFPDIDDEKALKYLKAALNNIRTKQKTEEVQKKRIKRLGLHPEFNRWQMKDIIQN